MDAPPADSDALIQQFCSFTDASPEEAEDCLSAHGWHVESSVSTWFAAQEGEGDEAQEAMSDAPAAATEAPQSSYVPGVGRTLGGGPVPASAAPSSTTPEPSSSRRAPPPRGGPRTLKDLQGDSGHGHAHDDDSDDEDQDMFAGGEKSGLAVQNPGNSTPQDQINNILERARRNVPRPGGDEPEAPSSRFTGRGVTLGGEGAESNVVADPTPTQRTLPRASRTLHLWSDGFSVDDGPLFRYDDPANAQTLQMIQQGRAPLELLNVEHAQEVDLMLDNQKETKFVQPKKKYVPFSGSGQRLGSPTPGVASSSSQAAQTSMAIPGSAAPQPEAPSVNVNDSEPTISLQIRLGDGTRLSSRFNTSHTVGDVYSFVDAASTASTQRAYALMTTFPNKELDNKGVKLGDLQEFKRGGVVVQKWK